MKTLEALERIWEMVGTKEDYAIIEKELILLNALRNKLNRKVETKEYKHEASNRYRITTLLTYELKEQWNDKELQALQQFLLNLSGISKELKALEIIKKGKKEYLKDEPDWENKNLYDFWVMITDEEYDLLTEVLKND